MTAPPLTAERFPIGSDAGEIRRVYGDPEPFLVDGDDRDWRERILSAPVQFPAAVRYSGTSTLLTRICVHRLLAPSLTRIFDQLTRRNAWRYVSDCAGAYAFRLMRGGTRLSLHSWAAAIDLNADSYPLGSRPSPNDEFVRHVVPVFEAEGWQWGGRWTRPDAMHFQATKGA